MKHNNHRGQRMDGQPPGGGIDTAKTGADGSPSPPHALLMELLASSIVLVEDFDKLSDPVQDEISQCPGTRAMLGLLVRHGLMTEYQARRVEAGTTYGLVLGSYRVLDRLGAGGMGVVFKAEHVDMRRPVAVKVLTLHGDYDPRIEQRFLQEIRVVAQLQHPNIVAAMDAGKTSAAGSPTLRYFVMELVPGQDLEEYINATGPIPPAQACDIIHQVAAALVEADKHGLVHRDIKPANVRLTPEGQAKLLDFGLTRQFAARMTEPGTVLGTIDFMAPEQTFDAGSVDIRADIYALGSTLFWCLTGNTPFPPKDTILLDILSRQTQPTPSVRAGQPAIPADLDAVVARMMARNPADRYATPRAVMQALLPFLKPEMRDGPPTPDGPGIEAGAKGQKRPQQILVVDDEPPLRRLCRFALEAEGGPQCDEAANGLLALEMIAAKRYDLVISDIDMPGMTGPELCRHLRDNPPTPHLKVIMMSGRATPDEMSKMLLNGADDYLGKPLSMVQLQSKVNAALRLKDAQDRTDSLNSHLLAVNHELERTLTAGHSDMVQARNGIVRAVAKLVSDREGGSGAHLLRMEQYSRLLAEEAAREPAFAGLIDANFIDLLACCAPLHDIGKVGLPDHILLKPGKLDADERVLMQTHTTTGSDTLRGVMNEHGSALAFVQMAADIIRHHHERYDGGGYPDGLAGESIPLSARIACICDVYDALRSRRSYKPALSHAASVQVMTKVSGEQFDPTLLQLFYRCAHHFERIFRELTD